jgi:N-acetylglucosaminyldiphosphoundecaprenol N-acetyl-beta-D-mannosaminyltransferase
MMDDRTGARVNGVFVDALPQEAALARILAWGRDRQSRFVTFSNVHVVTTGSRDEDYGRVLAGADLALPDGAPVAWMLRRLGFPGQPRLAGPDLTWLLCGRCEALGLPVYFYGSTPETLAALRERLHSAFPALRIAGMESPPFRPLSDAEDAQAVARINDSGAGLVFVGLGCPKQERWMAAHRGRVNSVMLGVGAAFDLHAGTARRAPPWMRRAGLEWLHRLASEPRRLMKRYLVTNTLFVVDAFRQLAGAGHRRTEPPA